MSIAPINKAILAKKIGTTQIFDEQSGNRTHITVLEAGPCQVVQKKSKEVDGYNSIQLGYEDQRKQRINKPQQGHFKKAGLEVKKHLKEFKFSDEVYETLNVGDTLNLEQFSDEDYVDITAFSKGKGFAGVMKRYNFAGRPATHGTHESFRGPGSVGMHQTPGRIIKGKKMPGHMGDSQVTIQNLSVEKVDPENNLIYVNGTVPGSKNSIVIIRDSVKKPSEPYYTKDLKESKEVKKETKETPEKNTDNVANEEEKTQETN